MNISKIVGQWMIVMSSFFIYMNAQAATQDNPVALLTFIAEHMIDGLKTNKANLKTKPQVVYQLANQYVVPYADLTYMSQRVLSPEVWNHATQIERQQFQHAFTTTVIRTYASALSSYEDQTIKFFPLHGGYKGLNTVVVNSQIESSQSSPIQVTYRLIRRGNVWRLYDMSVEGVSLIESFRSQFSDILAQGNMATLLKRMNTHNQGNKNISS